MTYARARGCTRRARAHPDCRDVTPIKRALGRLAAASERARGELGDMYHRRRVAAVSPSLSPSSLPPLSVRFKLFPLTCPARPRPSPCLEAPCPITIHERGRSVGRSAGRPAGRNGHALVPIVLHPPPTVCVGCYPIRLSNLTEPRSGQVSPKQGSDSD